MCFLTGQLYIKNIYCSLPLIPVLILIGSVNLYSTAFNFYVISCPYRNCGYIDTVRPHNSKSFLLTGPEPLKAIYYNDFQKFVYTCASIAGTLSYFSIIASINYNRLKSGYQFIKKMFKKNKDSGDGAESSSLLDQIGDNDDTEKGDDRFLSPFHDHKALNWKQVCIFWAIFTFNCALYVGSAVVFFIIFSKELDKNASKKMKFWDAFGLVSQFVSWFCAILSCFIFSKLAHTISNKCVNDLFQHLKEVNKMGIKKDIYATLNEKFGLNMSQRDTDKNTFFEVMKDLDREYAKVMKNSLECYGAWFAIHWLSYTVTAFLAIAYFIQHVKEDLYNNDEFHCHKEANQICKLSLVYDLLFCLSHCILFLYPCFRAASVTAARYKVIRKISRADWKNIPFDQMQAFIQYMERQDCTFKVSILCATVTFGFNLAYFSIFAGIMTVILKISL